jgi:hypothetical protein
MKEKCMLIDGISGERNVIKKKAKKIVKYKDLSIKVECVLNVKTKVIPEITGVTGTVSKLYRKYLSNILGKHEIKELRKQL